MSQPESPPIRVFAPMDFRQMPVEDGSVDLVMTDPLYHRKHLDDWEEVARWSAAKLKDGGRFFAFTGTHHLPDVLERTTRHLNWISLFTVLFSVTAKTWWTKKLCYIKQTKFAVFASKGEYGGKQAFIKDVYHAQQHGHEYHKWQLPLDAVLYWMERMTNRGDLVVDPFAGSWTTGIAARKLHRRYVGTDVDPATMSIWHRRLQDGD